MPAPTAILLSALLALGANQAHAQDHAEASLDISGSLRLDIWSGDRQLSDSDGVAAGSLWLRGRLDLGDAGQVVAQGWGRGATHEDGAPGGRVRELYWRRRFGALDLRVGRLMPVWGRADGFNPTDNLSPRDFTLLAPEDVDQRYGNDGIAAALEFEAGSLEVQWFPRAAGHTIPLPRIPGVRYRVDAPPDSAQWSLKWERLGEGADWSVSYFDGDDLWPDFALRGFSPAGVDVGLQHHRLRALGADLSLARGNVVWRAEAALTRTDSRGRGDFTRKKPQLWLVAGPEWTLPNDGTLSLQFTAKRVFDYAPVGEIASPLEREVARVQVATAAQTARDQYGLIWRVAKRWNYDKLRAEASGVVLGPGRNGISRAQLQYALSERWTLQTGVVSAFGAQDTPFGQLRDNNLGYLQLRYGFGYERTFGTAEDAADPAADGQDTAER